jgi:L-malate glycosyltransferase
MNMQRLPGNLPRLCLVGPMVGRTPGFVTTQGEILTDLFRAGGYPVISMSDKPTRYGRFLDKIWQLLRHRREMDLIMIQTYSGLSFVIEDIASWLGKRMGKPILFHLRGGALPEFMARYPRWSRRVFRRADWIVAPSTYLARAIETHGFHAQIIPNAIRLPAYPYRLRTSVRPRLFWMRSFHAIYNPHMAIRVLAALREIYPDASLVMGGGDKGLRADVQRLASTLGVADAVRFPGFLNMADKIREGSQADIFISTNTIDNMPVAVIEACSLGLPVVSTNVGGMPDLLEDGKTGMLVRDNDTSAMTAAIQRLVEEPDLASRLSAAGRQLAQRSSWEEIFPQWQKLIALLLDGEDSARCNAPGSDLAESGRERRVSSARAMPQ